MAHDRTPRNTNTRYDHHTSVSSLIRAALADDVVISDRRERDLLGNSANRVRFRGIKFPKGKKAIRKLADGGWADGADTVSGLISRLGAVNLKTPVSIQRKRDWADHGRLNIGRVIQRADKPFRRTRKAKGFTGKPMITIYAAVGGACFRTPEALFWRAAAAIVLTDMLERAGYRVRVIGFSRANDVFTTGAAGHCLSFVAKDFGDHLNIAALCTALAPWFFRSIIFRAKYARGGAQTSDGLGWHTELENDDRMAIAGDTDGIVCDEIWDENEAVEWISQTLDAIESGSRAA